MDVSLSPPRMQNLIYWCYHEWCENKYVYILLALIATINIFVFAITPYNLSGIEDLGECFFCHN